MKIRQLSVALANQIAAGEVIERPASVVKELLENALDAGASSISIEIAHGGLNQIRISDNGAGIHAEDLPLAIAPHATSKICELSDLFKIESMGFRGEALASIASIARISILSKTAEANHAQLLTMDESGVQVSPAARNTGTTVDVCDLFYNAPVRKKFLKTAKLEFQAIETIVKKFALGAPAIDLTLKHEGKTILTLAAANSPEKQKQRLAKIFGQSFIKDAHYLQVDHAGMQLSGWISNAECQRSQNDRLWIYVNQRMVKDKLLQHAIKSAYESVLHPGRFPACLLYFTINPEEVDVNVHPTKHELRFQQPRLVHDFFTTHITKALDIQPQSVFKPSLPKKEYKPALQESKPVFHSESPWVILNSQFGLLFRGRDPWLVNMQALMVHVSFELLKNHDKPLASRPLLVPLYYAFQKNQQAMARLIQRWLQDLGISCEMVEADLFRIRTLPVILPQLDIQQCMDTLFILSEEASDTDLYKILSESQFIDVFQLDNATKSHLAAALEYMDEKQRACFVRELHTERLGSLFV